MRPPEPPCGDFHTWSKRAVRALDLKDPDPVLVTPGPSPSGPLLVTAGPSPVPLRPAQRQGPPSPSQVRAPDDLTRSNEGFDPSPGEGRPYLWPQTHARRPSGRGRSPFPGWGGSDSPRARDALYGAPLRPGHNRVMSGTTCQPARASPYPARPSPRPTRARSGLRSAKASTSGTANVTKHGSVG